MLRILHIEDDPYTRKLVHFILRNSAMELIQCASGDEALAWAQDQTPDLILLDVMMPDMDGPTTLQHLRARPHLAATPVIFTTATVQPADVAALKALGASSVIAKPFDPMQLDVDIRRILYPSSV